MKITYQAGKLRAKLDQLRSARGMELLRRARRVVERQNGCRIPANGRKLRKWAQIELRFTARANELWERRRFSLYGSDHHGEYHLDCAGTIGLAFMGQLWVLERKYELPYRAGT